MYVAAAFIFQQGITRVSQVALVGKDLPASSRDTRDSSSITGLERSPRVVNETPLSISCLENSRAGGAWRATAHGAWKSGVTEQAGIRYYM